MVDGRVHHFSAGGLYNGLILLIDDETRTYWDHITGEAVHGELVGKSLPGWPLQYTTVEAALEKWPDLRIARLQSLNPMALFMGFAHRKKVGTKGFLPPGFRGTMSEPDPRLDAMEQGVGVVDGQRARFFPTARIGAGVEEDWNGRRLTVLIGEADRVPFAQWDDGSRPMQLFTRWYGFHYTYPGCELYEG